MRFGSFGASARRIALMGALSMLALATVMTTAFASSASAAGAGFGLAPGKFESGTCKANPPGEECTYETEELFYTQSTGHPNFGITNFEFNSTTIEPIPGLKTKVPDGNVKNIRVDLPLGLSVNPDAVPQCSMEAFDSIEAEEGVYTAPLCEPDTEVGTQIVEVTVGGFENMKLEGIVYDLEQPPGVPTELGVAIDISSIAELEQGKEVPAGSFYAHTLLEGGVSWHAGETYASGEPVPHSGNYHEYFKINEVSETLPLVSSRLIFNGQAGTEGQPGTGFLTMPSKCGPAPTTLWVESYEGEIATETTEPPAQVNGCEKVPFKPEVNVKTATTKADASDGATVEVLVPQNSNVEAINSSTLANAEVTLPAGMTFNPAAAVGLTYCTEQQFGRTGAKGAKTSEQKKSECPPASKIGTATIETPTLPAGSLTGGVYVGQPVGGASPSSGEEYRIFIDAESERYGVTIRLEGEVKANESTGQLTTIVAENPPLPFTDFLLYLEEGAHTPLANPITCTAQSTTASFLPYSALTSTDTVAGTLQSPFTVTECAKFAPTQATSFSASQGGAETAFSFTLTRPEGEPYVSTLSTTLPPGLVGKIPSVPLCEGAAAETGACAATSSIGTAAVELGSGNKPLDLGGTVYLTGPYDGAPYGLTIVVPATSVGPYNYGNIVTRAKLEVNPSTAQVTVASQLPIVVGGAQIRLRSLNVTVTHAKFLINPTNCAALTTTSALTSTLGETATASSPFQATGCSSLKFKPTFKAGSSGKPSRRNGASLKTTLTLPEGDANVQSVSVTLPKKLPSRDSSLDEACLLATFQASPASCPKDSQIGEASVVTPVLPGTLKGKAYYVSLGHSGFPNVDIVLEGDGVTIVLVGDTEIKGGITHTKFLTLPDVPIKTFSLKLPMGEKSALSANASLCKKPLYLPTSIVAQSGATFTQKTKINVTGCPIVVTKHKVKGKKVQFTVRTPSAGKIVTTGAGLVRKTKKVAKAKTATITEQLTAAGARKLAAKRKLKLAVHVKFTPKTGNASKASFKVKLKS
jgi:hypothetical protein